MTDSKSVCKTPACFNRVGICQPKLLLNLLLCLTKLIVIPDGTASEVSARSKAAATLEPEPTQHNSLDRLQIRKYTRCVQKVR
jgi:hypothetical protein